MEKRRSYVYKITCKITGEYYFGSSFRAKRDSYWGSGRRIKERISQYGKENFIKEILVEFDDRTIAHQVENQYIDKFRNDDKCLNQQLDHKFGTFSDETRSKIGAAQCGEKNPMCGKHHTAATRSKMSAAKCGEKNPWYGKHLSEETRSKIGAAQRGEKHHNFGKHLSDETKQKIRESMRCRTPWIKDKKLNKETGKYE